MLSKVEGFHAPGALKGESAFLSCFLGEGTRLGSFLSPIGVFSLSTLVEELLYCLASTLGGGVGSVLIGLAGVRESEKTVVAFGVIFSSDRLFSPTDFSGVFVES
jgi:hypothetical protein